MTIWLTRISVAFGIMIILGGMIVESHAQTTLVRGVLGTGGSLGSAAGQRRLSATLGQPIMGAVNFQGNPPAGVPATVYQGFWVPIIDPTSVDETTVVAGPDMIVYPNPMRTTVSVVVPVMGPGEATMVIRDLLGNLIKEISVMTSGSDRVEFLWDGTDINGNPVASGGYLCRAVAPTEMTGRMQVSTARIQVVR